MLTAVIPFNQVIKIEPPSEIKLLRKFFWQTPSRCASLACHKTFSMAYRRNGICLDNLWRRLAPLGDDGLGTSSPIFSWLATSMPIYVRQYSFRRSWLCPPKFLPRSNQTALGPFSLRKKFRTDSWMNWTVGILDLVTSASPLEELRRNILIVLTGLSWWFHTDTSSGSVLE